MDDKVKNQVLIGLIAFSGVVMLYQMFFNMGEDFTWAKLGLAMLLGGVAAGAAFGATRLIQK